VVKSSVRFILQLQSRPGILQRVPYGKLFDSTTDPDIRYGHHYLKCVSNRFQILDSRTVVGVKNVLNNLNIINNLFAAFEFQTIF
jgi:hypothetical protein